MLKALAPIEESRDQYLLSRANLHAQIGSKYYSHGLPWAIPHYEAARQAWEERRSRVSDARKRRNLLDRAAYKIYYPLILAYLGVPKPGGSEAELPPYPAEDAAQQEPFARERLPDLLAGAATARAFEVLEAVQARSFSDRLAGAEGDREARPALCAELPDLLADPEGGEAAALAAWLCLEDRLHLFLFQPGESVPGHFELPVGGTQLGEVVAQLNDDCTASTSARTRWICGNSRTGPRSRRWRRCSHLSSMHSSRAGCWY